MQEKTYKLNNEFKRSHVRACMLTDPKKQGDAII